MAKATLPGAAGQTVGDFDKEKDPPTAINLKQAARLLEEIASVAARVDRECFYELGELDDDGPAERAFLIVARIRDSIQRIGWMADLGSEKLTGHTEVRGDAESWLLAPSYKFDVEPEASNG